MDRTKNNFYNLDRNEIHRGQNDKSHTMGMFNEFIESTFFFFMGEGVSILDNENTASGVECTDVHWIYIVNQFLF